MKLKNHNRTNALPKLFWFTPTFPTCPTVAEQFLDIKRTSPEGNFNVADFPSFAISFATAPAALANCPPFPSVISMLCMAVPKGISVEVDSSFLSIKTPSQTVQASSKAYGFLDVLVSEPGFPGTLTQGMEPRRFGIAVYEGVTTPLINGMEEASFMLANTVVPL